MLVILLLLYTRKLMVWNVWFVITLVLLLFCNLLQNVDDSELIRTRLQLEAREQEMDRLESKMTTGAKLLADKDSRLRRLEFSLLDNTAVCFTIYF